jgi:hypothetical protein
MNRNYAVDCSARKAPGPHGPDPCVSDSGVDSKSHQRHPYLYLLPTAVAGNAIRE